ncbi:MAG: hypothetical protein ABJA98_20745 [Acidobacteriota bacterium]
MQTLDAVIAVLRHRGKTNIADLMARSKAAFRDSDGMDSWSDIEVASVELSAPIGVYDQLKSLPRPDRDAILVAFRECQPDPATTQIRAITFRLDTETLDRTQDNFAKLLKEIEAQKALMIDVATGGARIQNVNDAYIVRRAFLAKALSAGGLKDSSPYASLWDWYKKWKDDLPSYQSRREYVSDLYKPLSDRLEGPSDRPPLFDQPTGWTAIDIGQGQMRETLARAQTAPEFQSVGVHCRELMISLAQEVYDGERHPAIDETAPSRTDAKRMLEAYVAVELAGKTNEELRKHARAAFDLANALQHRRTATFRDAALCAEATTSIVNLIAIVSGRRDPGGP